MIDKIIDMCNNKKAVREERHSREDRFFPKTEKSY